MDKIIEDITRKIVEEVNPGRLVLFGSRALGKQKAESDIDLCIIESKTIDKSREFMKVRKILGDFIQPMDILFFNRDEFEKRKDIWGTVQYEIDKKGIILYERGD